MSTAPTGDPLFLVRVAGGGGIGLGKEPREPPADGVSSLRFSSLEAQRPPPSHLLGQVAPVLDCCFHNDFSGFSVGGDNTVGR
ncbi:hypothetical protein ABZP36_001608 [Zizania latifolia]